MQRLHFCLKYDVNYIFVGFSCPKISWMEEKNFMLFEVAAAVMGTLAYVNVMYRQKRLDTMLMEKVHRQIASGV